MGGWVKQSSLGPMVRGSLDEGAKRKVGGKF